MSNYKFDENLELKILKDEEVENVICTPVTKEEASEIIKLGEKMIEICSENNGIGLAAPQVGVNKRMFVWMNGMNTFQIVLNPSFIPQEKKKTHTVEGCLSYPGRDFYMERYKRILAKFQTFSNGKFFNWTKQYSSEKAFIFSHEFDHLNGITVATNGKELFLRDKNKPGVSEETSEETNKLES